jgi:zinc and cadmium transporter
MTGVRGIVGGTVLLLLVAGDFAFAEVEHGRPSVLGNIQATALALQAVARERQQPASPDVDAIPPTNNIGWWPIALLTVYCLLIVLASLGGGWLPMLMSLTHNRMQLMLSLVGGLMLGIGVFHMLPHAVHQIPLDRAVWWMMVGMLTMFFLIRTFHFHQHEPLNLAEVMNDAADAPHDHDHGHGHAHSQNLGWLGITLGLSLHTLIDGIALGASVTAATSHSTEWQLLGLGTFLAIALHKPLDAVSITSLMLKGGWTAGWRHAVNGGFALMCPLGAFLFVLGIERFAGSQAVIVGCALAFAAGAFLCISLGDLLPEMEFHTHNRLPLSIALLAGIALAWGIRYLEPQHLHSAPTSETQIDSTARAAVTFEQNLSHTADAAGAALAGGVEFHVTQTGHAAAIDADKMRMTAVIGVAGAFQLEPPDVIAQLGAAE